MARPRTEPAVPSSLIPLVLRAVQRRGVDPASLIVAFSLPADAASRDEVALSPSGLSELLEAAAEAVGDPHLGLALPSLLAAHPSTIVELVVRASVDVAQALAAIARYARLFHPTFEATFEGGELRLRTPGQPRGVGRVAHEYVIGFALSLCRAEAGDDLTPIAVRVPQARPRDVGALHLALRTSAIEFGSSETALVFHPSDLVRPMRGDARLSEALERIADATIPTRSSGTRVVARLAAQLRSEPAAGVEEAARMLRMSGRTLQRRLEAEGTTFVEVHDAVRSERARAMLADHSISLVTIAEALAFSDLAAFSRAFRRWTGMPPGRFRQGLAER